MKKKKKRVKGNKTIGCRIRPSWLPVLHHNFLVA